MRAQVSAVLMDLADRYAAQDVDGVVQLFDRDAMLVGTGADEIRAGTAQIRVQAERDFAQADTVRMTFKDMAVTGYGDTACAYADTVFEGTASGRTFTMPARCTATLVRSGDRWRIVQWHASVPGEQEPGESFPV